VKVTQSLSVTVVLAVLGCGRSGDRQTDLARGSDSGDAGLVHVNAASIDPPSSDAGFVSAIAELAPATIDAGGARGSEGARGLSTATMAGQALDIPAGTFASGSTPGDEGREAAIEPALVEVTLGAYAIDALPYPNDPTAPPTMVSSQDEAVRLCSERGARLCSELEWEHACKGPSGDPFATGAKWNDACDTAPSRCASGFGVRAMGFLREWTDSKFTGVRETPVIRGGPKAHRCAARARSSIASEKNAPSTSRMAFRCCHGDRTDAAIAPIGTLPAFRKTNLEASDLVKIFAQVPELSRISENVRLYSDADVKTILARSSSDGDGIVFATSPIVWSPEPGVELLVATGRAKKTGFVVALHPLPHDKYRFASSFLLLNEPLPVALAYEPSRRKELRWTTCWNCAGEQGGVGLRDDGRTVIVQY
jgi:formylglycine-generating enzyme required for sulfatase activity